MICDTNFLTTLHDERRAGAHGPASAFLARRRRTPFLVTVISLGEAAVIFADTNEAREFLSPYRALRLTPEIAYAAASVDKELLAHGARLGENDNWIAAFCIYYRQPLISRDRAFDRVQGLRRVEY